jgi:hypothetical protein
MREVETKKTFIVKFHATNHGKQAAPTGELDQTPQISPVFPFYFPKKKILLPPILQTVRGRRVPRKQLKRWKLLFTLV